MSASGELTIERVLDFAATPAIYLFSLVNSVVADAAAVDGSLVSASGASIVNANGAFLVNYAASFRCAFTSPATGATELQGRTVVLTGTISRAATVQVTVNGNAGTAIVSGLTWSSSYVLQPGDVGTINVTARATAADTTTADATPITLNVLAVLPLSFWWAAFDLTAAAGSQNDSFGSVASLVGAQVLAPSPVVAPKLQKNAVNGNTGARVMLDTATNANFQFFTCNAFAPSLRTLPALGLTIAMEVRQDRTGDLPYWACLRSDGSGSEQLFGRLSAESYQLQKTAPGVSGGTQSLSAVRHTDPYSNSMVLWDFRPNGSGGFNLFIYTRASGQTNVVTDALGTIDPAALSAALDRFTWLASVSSIPFQALSGYGSRLYLATQSIGAANAKLLFDEWTFDAYTQPQATSPNISTAGASRTASIQDVITSAGWRDVLRRFVEENALSWYTDAQGIAGNPGALPGVRIGDVGNTFCSSGSGQPGSSIAAQAVLDIQNSPGPTLLWSGILSDQEANGLMPQATQQPLALSQYTAIMNAGLARDSRFRIVLATQPALADSTEAALILTYNTGTTKAGGIRDSLIAAFPHNPPFFWDYATATGPYGAAYWGADLAHLNRLGNIVGACDPVNGMLWASDGTQTFGQWLRSMSPSAARPIPLTGAISGLSAGFSIPHGTPVTLTVKASRVGFRALTHAGSNSGYQLPTEIYDNYALSGDYAHTPDPQGTYTFTPAVGDVGALTISAVFTDVDGVTTATASVSGTVT